MACKRESQGAEDVGLGHFTWHSSKKKERHFTWLWLDLTLDYFLQQKKIYIVQ